MPDGDSMALWRYEIELPDGSRRANVLAAGNFEAALARAKRNAKAWGGALTGTPEITDARKGTM